MLTLADIENARFTTTRLREGYDQDEVDTFLDRVAEEFKILQIPPSEITRALIPVAPIPQVAPIAPPPSQSATLLLEAAQRVADEAVAEAQKEADRIVAEARAEADRLVGEGRVQAQQVTAQAQADADTARATAHDEAQQIVASANAERQAEIARLEAQKTELTAAVTELQGREHNYRTWLSGAVAAFSKQMEGGPAA